MIREEKDNKTIPERLLNAIHDLLRYVTEDAVAHGFMKNVPSSIMQKMNDLCDELGKYLDSLE